MAVYVLVQGDVDVAATACPISREEAAEYLEGHLAHADSKGRGWRKYSFAQAAVVVSASWALSDAGVLS